MTSSDERERTRLTRDAVVDRALAMADAGGLDTLTIRKLAAELGVTPMALYWHFRSKDELLDGLADQVWREINVEVDPVAPWADQFRGLYESLLAVLRSHPAAAGLLLRSKQLEVAGAMQATEAALEILRSAGFGLEDASAITRSALWTGLSLVMSEPGNEYHDEAERAEGLRQKQVRMATLPLAKFPRLVECALPMTACDDPDMHYAFGVELFMAGVTALAATRARPVPTSG